MSGPEQPWWARPGGAPIPGGPPPRPPFTHQSPPQRTPSRRWPLITAIAAGAVLVAAAGWGVWKLADPRGPRLDIQQAEVSVAQILSDPINGYGANDVAAVVCNHGENPLVRVGVGFTCDVEINGTIRHVDVEFTRNDGTYAVDGPR